MHRLIEICALLLAIASLTTCSPHEQAYAAGHQSLAVKQQKREQPCYSSAPGHTCAAHGHLAKPRPIEGEPSLAPDEVYCRTTCLAVGYTSFSWNPETLRCRIFYKTIAEQAFTPGNSTRVFYDVACFECLNTCPQPEKANIIVNGGFEQLPQRIKPWDNEPNYKGVVTTPGDHSPQAYHYVYNPEEGDYLGQTWYVCGKATYMLSFTYKYLFSKKVGYASILYEIANVRNNIHPTLAQNDTWIPWSFLYELDTSGYASLVVYPQVQYARSKVFLDNFVSYAVNPEIKPSAANLVTNPTFEDGTINGWKSKSCTIGSPGHQSDYAAVCNATYQAIPLYTLYQNITTQTNTPYFIGFDYKVVYNHKDNNCYFFVHFGHQQFESGFDGIANNTWLSYSFYTISHHETNLLGLQPGDEIQGAGFHCTFYWDNVVVKEARY